jgi:histidine kinase
MFSQQLKLRQIEVVRLLDEQIPSILADANRLEQVFINLLVNARDSLEEKGGAGECVKRITLQSYAQDDTVIVKVADTGTGIQAPILDKIFEPFFTTKTQTKGTGLGLSISYGIVQDYNGTIDVETEEGQGTTFTVQFPAYHRERSVL